MVSRRFYSKVNQVLKSRIERKTVTAKTDFSDDPPYFNKNGIKGQAGAGFAYGIANFPIPIPGTGLNNYVGTEIDVTSYQLSMFVRNDIPAASGHFRLIVWQWFPTFSAQNVSSLVDDGMFTIDDPVSSLAATLMVDNGVLSPLANNSSENMLALYGRADAQNYAILHDQIYKYDPLDQQTGYTVPAGGATYNVPSVPSYYKFINLIIKPVRLTCSIDRFVGENSHISEVTNWVYYILIDLNQAFSGAPNGNTFTVVARTNFTDA